MSGTPTTTFKVTFSSNTGSIQGSGYDGAGNPYNFNFDAGNEGPQEYSINEKIGKHTVNVAGWVAEGGSAQFDVIGKDGDSIASHYFTGDFGLTSIDYEVRDTGPE